MGPRGFASAYKSSLRIRTHAPGVRQPVTRHALPAFARVDRTRPAGLHAYLELLPGARESPAMRRAVPDASLREKLLQDCRVHLAPGAGYCYIDVERPCIVLGDEYYRTGAELDLYLDLLHEFTHMRQLHEGADLWDERYAYVDRPTEIEGYAVAVEEGRRLGMTDEEVLSHLDNPWMDEEDVARLTRHVQEFLEKAGPLGEK
jgi:hypothetical protein